MTHLSLSQCRQELRDWNDREGWECSEDELLGKACADFDPTAPSPKGETQPQKTGDAS